MVNEIIFKELIDDLVFYSNKKSEEYLRSKAFSVYRKCLKNEKYNIANKISKKYKLDSIIALYKSDLAVSFGYLMYSTFKQQ